MRNNDLEQPLAGFRWRATAYLIDVGLFFVPLAVFGSLYVLLLGMSIEPCDPGGEGGCVDTGVMTSIGAIALAVVFAAFIWWLTALRWSQTPGKMLLRIQVLKKNGRSSGWGYNFVREVAIKGFPFIFGLVLMWTKPWILLLGMDGYYRNGEWAVFLPFAFAGTAALVDNLWALRDQNGQSVHDKVMGTLVVQKRPLDELVKGEV